MRFEKIRLNSLAKSTLLEHRMLKQKAGQLLPGDNWQWFKQYRTKIVKFLMISRSFLCISHREKIYKFLILEHNKTNNKFLCTFLTKGENYWNSISFKLAFVKFYKLIKFLRPRQINLNLDKINSFEAIEQCKQILKIVNGKIRLISYEDKSKTLSLISILLKKHKQISALECLSEFLYEGDFLPRLDLDSCRLANLISFSQLNIILKNHNITKLRIQLENYDQELFTFEDLDNNFCVAPTVTHLDLCNGGTDQRIQDDNLFKKMLKLVEFFPNLRGFSCFLSFTRDKCVFNNYDLYKLIFGWHSYSRQIQKACKSEANIYVICTTYFEVKNKDIFSHEWHNRLNKHPAFAKAKNDEDRNCFSDSSIRFCTEIKEENFRFSIDVLICYNP